MSTISHTDRITTLKSILAGIEKRFSNTKTLQLGGREVAVADLVAVLQTEIDALTASDSAKTRYRAAVLSAKDARVASDPPIRLLRRYVAGIYGETAASGEALSDFGFAPRKPTRALTSEEKAAAVEKLRATRGARHTMGKRQREKIHGAPVTPAPVATIPTAPTAPTPTPTPTNGTPTAT